MESVSADQDSNPPIFQRPEKWDYDNYFKEYLLLLATKGPIGLESTNRYPRFIQLNPTWHATLNLIRKTSQRKDTEKWAFIGVKEDRRRIFLPTRPISGFEKSVRSMHTKKMLTWARENHGIIQTVGDIHSHPMGANPKLDQLFPFGIKHTAAEAFSNADLFGFIKYKKHFLAGLVAGDFNVFAFKTRETVGFGDEDGRLSLEQFESYWYEKFGFKYLGRQNKHGVAQIQKISPEADLTKMNVAIAEQHRLVLFQGRANTDLVRIYPHQ